MYYTDEQRKFFEEWVEKQPANERAWYRLKFYVLGAEEFWKLINNRNSLLSE